MSNPTSNFNWQMPTATDLVTDLPADFEVFGQAVDSSMADLLGGTTGQILAKNSNTNMDFVWTTPNPGDITGVTAGTGISGGGTSGDVTITNSMATAIDAKGDLIAGTGADTFSRLAVGSNSQILVADSSTATGLAWATPAGGGGMTLLSTTALSGTTTTISSISGAYNNLYLLMRDNTQAGAVRFNGSTSLYFGIQMYANGATVTTTGESATGNRLTAGAGPTGSANMSAAFLINDYAGTTAFKPLLQYGIESTGPGQMPLISIGGLATTSAITSVDIVSDSGSWTAGEVLIYGVK